MGRGNNRDIPIMLGCYNYPDKVCVVAKDTRFGGYSLFVCRMTDKTDAAFGEAVDWENVAGVLCQLQFCKIESARAFLDSVQRLVTMWEQEKDGGQNEL